MTPSVASFGYTTKYIKVKGEVVEEYSVAVKGNKYGKDGEFGDKLDTYKYEGFVEPEEMVKEARERARQAMKDMYKRIGEKSLIIKQLLIPKEMKEIKERQETTERFAKNMKIVKKN